jgi:hypothetical protein
VTVNSSGVTVTGTFAATSMSGSGASLTGLNASNLSTGTVPDARFPATLPAASGVNLTALNASNLGSGTVPDARFPATLPAASGANLTSLNASNLSTGTVGTARLATGTANSSSYLRGDQTWATLSTGPNVWVNFDGTTLGIRGSRNVSSITRMYTGGYTVNFTTALADANYAFSLSIGDSNNWSAPMIFSNPSYSASSISIVTRPISGGLENMQTVCLIIFR